MLIWINLITSWAIGQKQQEHYLQHELIDQHNNCEKKTIMISAKPSPITKTTAVHVVGERETDHEESDSSHNNNNNNNKFIDEKPTAKIALSVELAKQQQQYRNSQQLHQHRWPGVRAESILSKSSVESLHRLMQTQQHQGDETSIYQQQQWNYSAKALPDTFSTRVSANGSVALSDSGSKSDSDSVGGTITTTGIGGVGISEEQQEHRPQSPAMSRLIKQHRQATIISETASLFSSSSEAMMTKSGAMIDQHRILDAAAAARGKEPCDQQPSIANDEGMPVVQTTATDVSSTTAPAATISSATIATIASTTSTSASTSSPPRRNPVLPIYEPRFSPLLSLQNQQQQQRPESSYVIGSILESTFSSFSSIFSNPTEPEEPTAESSWAKTLQAKISKIVSSDSKVDTTQHVNKKIAVVGIHGWFPTKVKYKYEKNKLLLF
ncbi:hypothetical protein BDA99DRAFT_288787 [Phascolomyces articulosus]|uniref:Uncharacterized protein n=1 Tax=Phascolomyces articulosus TaxID=60185 RepID=A0AAD5JLZ7_9FUNG|nr:hypothetical protein BDA99DRAFT_288787 [Phascolomyces articulosus]